MSDQTPQPKAPMRRSLRILLFASLAANLVIVGLVAGAVLGGGKPNDKPPRDADFMGAFTRALPDEDRRAIGRTIREHHRKSGFSREAARREFQSVLELLRTTPFDQEALTSLMEQQAQTTFDRRKAALTFWADRIAAMTDAERLDYADQIEAQIKRAPRDKSPRKGDGSN
jgi:uncharacterized membrane protein